MKNKAIISLTLSMVIFGTIGVFRKYIPLSSGMLAFSRGVIGAVFIILALLAIKKPLDFKKAKGSFLTLCVSGMLMGFNWIMLFESYNYTSVAAATLCYYMAPVIVIALSPVIFKERLGIRKIFCVCAAFFGMVLVSGIFKTGFAFSELKGVLLGLGAAGLYASVVIMNKKLGDVPAFERTVIQLISSAAAIFPYILFAEGFSFEGIGAAAIILLITVGIIHTGLAYVLYFGSIGGLKAQTAAIFSYIDPVVAIILSGTVLGEKIGMEEIFGAVLILGSTLISELSGKEN